MAITLFITKLNQVSPKCVQGNNLTITKLDKKITNSNNFKNHWKTLALLPKS